MSLRNNRIIIVVLILNYPWFISIGSESDIWARYKQKSQGFILIVHRVTSDIPYVTGSGSEVNMELVMCKPIFYTQLSSFLFSVNF